MSGKFLPATTDDVGSMVHKITLDARQYLSVSKKIQDQAWSIDADFEEINDKEEKREKERKKRTKSSTDDLAKFSREVKSTIAATGRLTLSFLGASAGVGLLGGMLSSTTGQMVRLGNAANFLGMSASRLKGFNRVFEGAGSTAQASQSLMARLRNSRNIQYNNITGAAPDDFFIGLKKLHAKTGVDVIGSGASGDYGSMMLSLSDSLSRLRDDEAVQYAQVLGIDENSLAALRDPNFSAKQSEFQKSSSGVDSATREAQKIHDSLLQLTVAFEGVGNSIITAFGPDIIIALDQFSDWIKNNRGDIISFFREAGDFAKSFADKLGGAANAAEIFLYAFAGFKGAKLLGSAARAGRSILGGSAASGAASGFARVGSAVGAAGASGVLGGITALMTPSNNSLTTSQEMTSVFGNSFNHANSFVGGLDMGRLAYAQSMVESFGGQDLNAYVIRGDSPVGMFQIKPSTARDYDPNITARDLLDNRTSKKIFDRHMGRLLQKYGNPSHAITAYNWGEGNADRWISSGANPADLPEETRNYLRKASEYYQGADGSSAFSKFRGNYVEPGSETTIQIGTVTVNSNPESASALSAEIISQSQRRFSSAMSHDGVSRY